MVGVGKFWEPGTYSTKYHIFGGSIAGMRFFYERLLLDIRNHQLKPTLDIAEKILRVAEANTFSYIFCMVLDAAHTEDGDTNTELGLKLLPENISTYRFIS